MIGASELERDIAELRLTMERERRKLVALQEIGSLLGSTLDLNELLAQIVDRITEVVDADRSTLYLLDDETGELWAKVAQGEEMVEIRLRVGDGIAGSVAKSGKSLNIKDAYQDTRFDAEWDRRTGYRTRSILCVPMKNQHGRTIGAVQVLNKAGGHFTPSDEGILRSLAAQAAVSIENSKLFLSVVGKNIELLETQEQLQKKIRELNLLFEISQVSAGADAPDELLQGVLARSMRALDAEAATVLIGDADTGDLHVQAAVGGEAEAMRGMKLTLGQGIAGWVAKNNKGQVVNDVDEDQRYITDLAEQTGYYPTSVLCVPIRWDDGNEPGIGALEFLNKSAGRSDFTNDDLKMATVIAAHVSTAIEQSRRKERRLREQRLSALGTVLSSVLHDLKTPMTIIKGYSKMMKGEVDAEVRATYAETITRQVEVLDAMTKETLAFARGETRLLVRRVYLYKFFEELVQQLQHALGDRIDLELVLNDRGIAHFDEGKLQRAVHNLARNAAEATAGGDRKGVFRVIVDRDADDGLVLTFEDNGPGIPEEIRSKLFDSFITHGKKGGTGLGLAIVQSIVHDHFGTIRVESEPGRTAFIVNIPQLADYGSSSGGYAAQSA